MKTCRRTLRHFPSYYMQETAATYQIGVDSVGRTGFAFNGRLNNTGDALPDQPIQNGTDFISFSLSKDLGDVGTDTASNALFAIGLVRDPSIAFTPSPGGNPESRSPCFRTAFPSVGPAVRPIVSVFCLSVIKNFTVPSVERLHHGFP